MAREVFGGYFYHSVANANHQQQQNQSNRDRVGIDSNPQWMNDAKTEPSAVGEFGQDGNGVEAGGDPNYIYASQPGHNGNAGEGY